MHKDNGESGARTQVEKLGASLLASLKAAVTKTFPNVARIVGKLSDLGDTGVCSHTARLHLGVQTQPLRPNRGRTAVLDTSRPLPLLVLTEHGIAHITDWQCAPSWPQHLTSAAPAQHERPTRCGRRVSLVVLHHAVK